ncbi:MAG: hypothetical protein WBE26_02780 [Phycisphaerae bacterium]
MNRPDSPTRRQDAMAGNTSPSPARRLLIVEPEALVRWSLVTYLTKWFDVFTADSRATADHILDDQLIDAVVVSDDLSDRAPEEIEARARSRNPAARVVRTVTDSPGEQTSGLNTPRLEKPFELSKLAMLLGVPDASPSGGPCDNGCPPKTG